MDQSLLFGLAKMRQSRFSQIFRGFYGGALRRKKKLEEEFSFITKEALQGICEKNKAIEDIKEKLIDFGDKIVKALEEICEKSLEVEKMYLGITDYVKERTDNKTFVEIRSCFLTVFIRYFLRNTCLKDEMLKDFYCVFADVAEKAGKSISTVIKDDNVREKELAEFLKQVGYYCGNIRNLILKAQVDCFSAAYFCNIFKSEVINDDQFSKIKKRALELSSQVK